MIKKLTKHGNSVAIVIERPILDLIGASIDTAFDIVTDGTSLVLTPVKNKVKHAQFHHSINKIGEQYSESFKELAK